MPLRRSTALGESRKWYGRAISVSYKKKSLMLCFGRTLLSFDPFPRTTVETEEEAPILRGKEVEGKLLIGFTERSCVLSLKYHLSAVQSTVRGRQHLKILL